MNGLLAMTETTLAGLGREALQQALVDPQRASQAAAVIEAAARRIRQWDAVSIVTHARGVAAKQLGELDQSRALLRSAIRAGLRAGKPSLAGEARVSLAGTLTMQGRPRDALIEVSAALQELDEVTAAQARTQQAAILQSIGHNDEALATLRMALPVLLQHAGQSSWAVRALSNRSLLHIGSRSFRAAEADLLLAQKLCRRDGLETFAANVEHNLGWLSASCGEVIGALEHYALAEEKYAAIGVEVGALAEARARLFLSVRLVEEARAAADRAVEIHRSQGRSLQLMESELLLSTVALIQGDVATANEAARRALAGHRRYSRAGGVALAKYALLQADVAGRHGSVQPAQARRAADELAAAGWVVPALEARVLAGRLALERGQLGQARRDLRQAAKARSTGPADSRARAWLAEAVLRHADGRRAAAKRAVHAGIRLVDDYQASLGATELRAHVSMHRGGLADFGLQLAIEDRKPRQILSLVERGRASALLLRPPRPPTDPVLATALADLRTTAQEIEQRRAEGRAPAELLHRQVGLEGVIAERCRRFPATARTVQSSRRTFGELTGRLGDDLVLVEFIESGGALGVVTVAAGQVRFKTLGSVDPFPRQLQNLAFALRQLADPFLTDAGRRAAEMLEAKLSAELDAELFTPLERVLGERSLVIVPSASLQAMPWSALPTCAGRPVTVSPSARMWLHADEVAARSDRIVVVAGPGLPGALREAAQVAGMHPSAERLHGAAATVAATLAAIEGAGVVHLATHGVLRSDNPFFSALLLADGPVTVYELLRLDRAPVHVVLAACEAAASAAVAGDETLGLAAAMLSLGTVSLIAPLTRVADRMAVGLMQSYHRELRAGYSPAESLARAQERATAQDVSEGAAAASFVCLGAGHDLTPIRT